MKSRWNAAWLLLLALKAFGLQDGDPDRSRGLQCLWMLPGSVVNCSWSAQDHVNATHLFYQSIKFRLDQIHQIPAQPKQNWLAIERSQLILGDIYSVWLEVHGAAGTEASEKLNVSLHEIMKPPALHLDLVPSSSGVTVRWEDPHWSEHSAYQSLVYELRYKTSREAVWTYLEVDQVSQEGYDLEYLDPFTSYEVQARCIAKDRHGFWSEWSLPVTFKTPEAAPLGQVDVWREVHLSENSTPNLRLLWKPLAPEAARGHILNYAVDFLGHHKTVVASLVCACCSIAVPAAASYARVSACNSAGKTSPASLSLEETDLPGPQEVQVLAAQSLNVTWKFVPSPGGTRLEHYVVECREEASSKLLSWAHSPVDSNSILLRGDFRPREPYLVSVYAIYAAGSNSSAPVRAYFREGVPSVGPQAVQDRSISTTVSVISWEEIPWAYQSGHLTHYTIYLKNTTSRNPKVFRYIAAGAMKRSYTLEGLEPGTSYELWMTGSTSAGEGTASPVHHFHTPGAHWQVVLVVLLTVGFLLILAMVGVFLTRRWFRSFCHKVLPLWCWQKVPDPGHSLVIVKMDAEGAALAKDPSCQSPAKTPEEPEILEITEPALPQTVHPSQAVFSDYEKHFIPTLEELQRLA